MATTVIAQAWNGNLNPAFNPLKIIADSTNKNEDGFRYIFDVYRAGTSTKIAEIKPMPRFGDGYGESDISKILQSQVTVDFLRTLTTSQHALNSYIKVDVKIGEEYVSPINYTASLTQNGVFVKITATHTYIVGDQVIISQDDNGVANPAIEGLFTVVAVTGTSDFTISALWSNVNDATINGSTLYADNRKTIFRDITTLSNYTCFNGALSFRDFSSYTPNDYDLSGVLDKMLTDFLSESRILPTSHVWFNAFTNGNVHEVKFENSNGDIFHYDTTTAHLVSQLCVAHPDIDNTLSVDTGTTPLIKDDTEWYDVWLIRSGQKSRKYRFNIDKRCVINDYEIMFMDRMGAIGSFSFQLKDELNGTVKKTTYNKNITGSVASQRWGYSTTERGMTSIGVSQEQELTLRTNYMTEDENEYFAQLITSPYTWLRLGRDWYACTISDTSFKIDRQNVKRLIKKEIKVKVSTQDSING
jgi:hypothetical protein